MAKRLMTQVSRVSVSIDSMDGKIHDEVRKKRPKEAMKHSNM